MGRDDELFPVNRLGQSQKVEKKINRMDVNDIGTPDMPDHARCDRIALRAEKRDPNDVDLAEPVGLRQPTRRAEQAVEGNHEDVVSAGGLAGREIFDGRF